MARMFHDSTGIVATHVETGYQWVPGLWEWPAACGQSRRGRCRPRRSTRPCAALFEQYDVWRLYADPPYWQSWIAQWAGDPAMGPSR